MPVNLSKMGLRAQITAIEVDTPDARLDAVEADLATAQEDIVTAQDAADAAQVDATALQVGLVYAALTAGAEAGDARVVTVQIKDSNTDSVSAATKLRCQLLTAAMVPAAEADFVMAETGAGTEVSTTAKPEMIIQTSAGGAASITVTDVGGASGLTVYLMVTPLGAFGRPEYVSLAFDGA